MAFDCNILFFDEKKFSKKEISDISSKLNYAPNLIQQVSLQQVLKQSDILSVHLPLTASTENIISLEELNELRSNVCIVNTARGGIVNEKDLYIFLSENPRSYAGFDVYKEEPAINNPLFELKNFFGTSHRSSLTNEGILSMGMAAINGLDDNINIS